MASNTQIVMGSADEDYKELHQLAQRNKEGVWSCLKETKKGDLLFIYFTLPHSEIVASAIASSDAAEGENWRYEVGIKDVKLIEPPLTLRRMREQIPDWGWPKSPQYNTYLKQPIAQELLKLAKLKVKSIAESFDRTSSGGAGFGTLEQNRIVERAARKAFRLHYEKQGYEVVSREKENLGYDFDVSRDRETLHVELKGISGSDLRFPITANEVACARSDSCFRLAVVTETNSDNKHVHEFSRNKFLKHFDFTPLTFFAEAKSSLFA